MHGMNHSSAQHQQEMACNETLESMLVCNNNNKSGEEKKLKPPPEEALKCPRCDSSNTKFCYYNNYSLTQPRYFCKSCRRYWTKGGTLRNVPVGGGCRKNRRSSSSSSNSSSSSRLIRTQDHHPSLIQTNPLLVAYDSTDLSLAFARLQNGQLGFDHNYQNHDQDQFSVMGGNNNNNNPNNTHGFLDALRNGYLENPLNGFQNASYYGNNIGNAENVGGMNVNVEDQMGNLPYEDLMSSGATTQAVTVTTVKLEGPSGAREAAETGRVFWGYPWQLNGGGDAGASIMADVDAAGRQSNWITGINGSTNWHGLFNTPLMQGDVN